MDLLPMVRQGIGERTQNGAEMKTCLFGHKFGEWSIPFETEVTRSIGSFGDGARFRVTKQIRMCERCKLMITRDVLDGSLKELKP